jgi:hypothetical protein
VKNKNYLLLALSLLCTVPVSLYSHRGGKARTATKQRKHNKRNHIRHVQHSYALEDEDNDTAGQASPCSSGCRVKFGRNHVDISPQEHGFIQAIVSGEVDKVADLMRGGLDVHKMFNIQSGHVGFMFIASVNILNGPRAVAIAKMLLEAGAPIEGGLLYEGTTLTLQDLTQFLIDVSDAIEYFANKAVNRDYYIKVLRLMLANLFDEESLPSELRVPDSAESRAFIGEKVHMLAETAQAIHALIEARAHIQAIV